MGEIPSSVEARRRHPVPATSRELANWLLSRDQIVKKRDDRS